MKDQDQCPHCNEYLDQDPECGDRFCPKCIMDEEETES